MRQLEGLVSAVAGFKHRLGFDEGRGFVLIFCMCRFVR
jgi:hypothetical protein